MKKLLLLIFALSTSLISFSALSATAEYKQGEFIDQYKIIDVGGPNNNNLVFLAHQVPEVVIQVSSVNHHTSKENLLCWDNPEVLECPDDDLGGGVFRMPVLKQLNDIMLAGGVIYVGDLTDLGEKAIYRSFWYEYTIKGAINTIMADAYFVALNDLQKVRNLRSVYYGNGLDSAVALSISQNYINNGVEPTHDDLGLATASLQYRRWLRLFGHTGWFE